MKFVKIIFALLVVGFTLWAYNIGGIMAVAGLYVSGYSFYRLLFEENAWLPVGEIALSMAAWQWIIAPMIAYTMPDPMYGMSQSCDRYMLYTVPLYSCMAIAYFRFKSNFAFSTDDVRQFCLQSTKIAKYFILFGTLFLFFVRLRGTIGQFVVFVSYFYFIGFIILMTANPDHATKYFIIALIAVAFKAILHNAYHPLLVWGMFMIFTWFSIKKANIKRRLIIILICLLSVNTLQTVKFITRAYLHNGYSGDVVELFFNTLTNVVTSTEHENEDSDTPDNISRFNQGWIISMIYENVPRNHDYFYGRTIVESLVSAAVPRFLVPNKKGATVDDFIEMTGYNLQSGTSMGLSVLGESYGNFGVFGGCIFMFLWGWFIAKTVYLINKWSKKYCYMWIVFLPLICFNLIKAEQSFMSAFNWTIKGVVFTFIVIYFIKNILHKNV